MLYMGYQIKKCYFINKELLSEECISLWKPGAVITNSYDNKKYKMLEIIPCAFNCVQNSYVYQDTENPNHYYFIFGFGEVLKGDGKVRATVMAMFFILDIVS